jgi:drug/metabolite transporter (DMT)-like permease
MESSAFAYFALLFGVCSLSTSAVFVRLANAPSAVTAFYRLLFAALILLPFLLCSKKNRRELLTLSKKQWSLGLLAGMLLAVHYVLWFESLRFTSVASSTVLVTLQPLFSIAGGRFFLKERYDRLAVAGCLIAIMGALSSAGGIFRSAVRPCSATCSRFLRRALSARIFLSVTSSEKTCRSSRIPCWGI